MKKTLIFDLDGTLLDSLEDIAINMNKVLNRLGYEGFEVKNYKRFVGGGIDILASNVIKTLQADINIKELSYAFKAQYETSLHDNTKPYGGINELLEALSIKGHNLAVLSNKPHDLTCAYVKKFFSSYNFTQVFGQRDEVPKKPNPQVALSIAKEFGVACEECFFVGDTKVDMQTACNASMKAIGVSWGFRKVEELRRNGAYGIVSHPKEILEFV